MRKLVRMAASRLKRGPNARKDMGDPEKCKALALSRIANQIHPFIAKAVGSDLHLIDGFRTTLGMELLGKLDVEMDVMVTDEDLTPQQIAMMQGLSAIHREDWPLADKCEWVIEMAKTMPGKNIAAELGVDAAMVSNWRQFEKLIPEAKQPVRDGKVGLRSMVEIAKAPTEKQPNMLAAALRGVSAARLAEMGKDARDEGDDTPPEKIAKIKIPLAINTAEVTVNGVATVAGAPGEELSLEDAEGVLTQALKAVKEARKQGLGAKAFQAMCRDRAKASA